MKWAIDPAEQPNYETVQFMKTKSVDGHIVREPVNRFVCQQCNRPFGQLKALTYHKRWECGQIHTCEICAKEYRIIVSLKRHMKEIHNSIYVGPRFQNFT